MSQVSSTKAKTGKQRQSVKRPQDSAEAHYAQTKANELAELFVGQVNVPLLLVLGLWTALTKTVGLANLSHPPPFSFGYWFDDIFSGSVVFAAFLLAWGAEQAQEGAVKKQAIAVMGGVFAVMGVVCVFYNVIYTLVFVGLAAAHAVAYLRFAPLSSEPTKARLALSQAPLARTLVLVDGILLLVLCG